MMSSDPPSSTCGRDCGCKTAFTQRHQLPETTIVAQNGNFARCIIVSNIDVCWIELKSHAESFQNGLLAGPQFEECFRLSCGRHPGYEVLLAPAEDHLREVSPSKALFNSLDVNANVTIKGYCEDREPPRTRQVESDSRTLMRRYVQFSLSRASQVNLRGRYRRILREQVSQNSTPGNEATAVRVEPESRRLGLFIRCEYPVKAMQSGVR
jgi:hypothetical protein